MGEMKHTPGPWSCLSDPHKEAGQPDLPRWSVRRGKTPIIDGYFLREDDALLTAAAPDLRAIAEAIVAADHSDLGVIDLLLELKRIARTAQAALSKAEGRSLSSASGQEGGANG